MNYHIYWGTFNALCYYSDELTCLFVYCRQSVGPSWHHQLHARPRPYLCSTPTGRHDNQAPAQIWQRWADGDRRWWVCVQRSVFKCVFTHFVSIVFGNFIQRAWNSVNLKMTKQIFNQNLFSCCEKLFLFIIACMCVGVPVSSRVSAKIQQLVNTLKRPKRRPLREFFVEDFEELLEGWNVFPSFCVCLFDFEDEHTLLLKSLG